jgi:uncharacterized protein (TIGR03435 family)
MDLALGLVVGLSALVSAPSGEPKVGDRAPELHASSWLKGEPVERFEPGKVYVLEFFATWCGACRAAIPHLNELASALADEPIVFVAMTHEKRELVEAVLRRTPMASSVALDDGEKTFQQYGVAVLPHAVVVDKTGTIAAITLPTDITADALRLVLRGQPIDLPVKSNKTADLQWDAQLGAAIDSEDAIGHVILQRTSAISGASRFPEGTGRITGDGLSLIALIQLAYGSDYDSTACSLDNPGRGPYRISVKAPDHADQTARAMLRDLLHASFAFRAEWREIEKVVPVLRCDPTTTTPKLRPSVAATTDGMARHGSVQATKVKPSFIAQTLGVYGLGQRMIDETGLQGEFDIDVSWTPGDAQDFSEQLAALGLRFAMEKRKVSTLFVEPS